METRRIKQLVSRYTWAGPIIGFAVGFLFGPGIIWQYADFCLKSRSAVVEQIRVEKELYERLQLVQNEALSAIPQYIALRDRQRAGSYDYQIQNDLNVVRAKLVNLISEYNRLEVKLSTMEHRSPRWFVIPVLPMAPRLSKAPSQDGVLAAFLIEVSQDPLTVEVEKDLKDLFKQYGKEYPSSKNR